MPSRMTTAESKDNAGLASGVFMSELPVLLLTKVMIARATARWAALVTPRPASMKPKALPCSSEEAGLRMPLSQGGPEGEEGGKAPHQ